MFFVVIAYPSHLVTEVRLPGRNIRTGGCAAAGLQPPRQPRRAVACSRRGGGREGDSSGAAAGLRLCVGRQGGDAAATHASGGQGGSGGFDSQCKRTIYQHRLRYNRVRSYPNESARSVHTTEAKRWRAQVVLSWGTRREG